MSTQDLKSSLRLESLLLKRSSYIIQSLMANTVTNKLRNGALDRAARLVGRDLEIID